MNLAFLYWLLTATLLFFKLLSNSYLQGQGRKQSKTFPWPENSLYFGGTTKEDSPLTQRASACWRNDLENIPMFLILGLAFIMVGGSPGFMLIYGLLFFASRVLHSYFFIRARQPHRFSVYAFGVVLTLVMVVHTWVLALT